MILAKDTFRWAHERLAIAECRARVFSIPRADIRAEVMAERFFALQEAIFAHSLNPGPFMFHVHPTSLQPVTLPEIDE